LEKIASEELRMPGFFGDVSPLKSPLKRLKVAPAMGRIRPIFRSARGGGDQPPDSGDGEYQGARMAVSRFTRRGVEACIKVVEGNKMMCRTEYRGAKPYVTKDGSTIRELIHPSIHGNRNQSLAEATVSPESKTHLHRHLITEEIYFILKGRGLMTLGEEVFPVKTGDSVLIPPMKPHRLENTGRSPLKLLCACSPAYSHKDTELIHEGLR
jgi:mannose-6-phosphate isomerase-like protein (cupin superfamily)